MGSDANLGDNGHLPTYLYSMIDGAVLLYYMRFDYLANQIVNPGEEDSPYRENTSRIFFPFPYYNGTFRTAFLDDIRRITNNDTG